MPKIKGEHTSLYYMRVDMVVKIILNNELYLQSKRAAELGKIISQKLECSARSAKTYISEARKVITQLTSKSKEKLLQRALINRELLFSVAKEKKDWWLALAVAQDRDRLLGLYPREISNKGILTLYNSINFKIVSDSGLEKIVRSGNIIDLLKDPKLMLKDKEVKRIKTKLD